VWLEPTEHRVGVLIVKGVRPKTPYVSFPSDWHVLYMLGRRDSPPGLASLFLHWKLVWVSNEFQSDRVCAFLCTRLCTAYASRVGAQGLPQDRKPCLAWLVKTTWMRVNMRER
jgi:hypothetical protein